MRKTMGVVGVVVVVACFARVVTALPTADEVFEKMVKKAEDIKTVACDMKMSGKPQGQQEMKGQGRRTAEFLKKEDGSIVRKMRMEMKLRVSMQGQEMEMETKAVSDGEWVWVENKSPMMPQVMVMKMKADVFEKGAKTADDPVSTAKRLKESLDGKVVGEGSVDGVKTWVIEGKPKEGAEGMEFRNADKIKIEVGQQDYTTRRIVSSDKDGVEIFNIEMTKVKINEKLPEDTFKYTAPPGAQVMDMSKMGGNVK